MLEQLDWVHVDSSNLAAAAYDDGKIYVMFKRGEIYEYTPQDPNAEPLQDYLEMLEVESAGQFLHNFIVPRYKAARLN